MGRHVPQLAQLSKCNVDGSSFVHFGRELEVGFRKGTVPKLFSGRPLQVNGLPPSPVAVEPELLFGVAPLPCHGRKEFRRLGVLAVRSFDLPRRTRRTRRSGRGKNLKTGPLDGIDSWLRALRVLRGRSLNCLTAYGENATWPNKFGHATLLLRLLDAGGTSRSTGWWSRRGLAWAWSRLPIRAGYAWPGPFPARRPIGRSCLSAR